MTAALRLTPEQAGVLSLMNAGRDPEVFAEKIMGLRLNPAQRRWFRLVKPGENGWQWRLKMVVHVAANQIGKTIGIAVLLLWACWYKIGVPTDDPAAWQRAPYMWFHLAPKQQQAYIPLKDMVLLLEGVHPAQVEAGRAGYKANDDALRLIRSLVQQVKIEQYYDGLSFWNGAMIQFRTTEDKAKALQGRRAAGISYDEAAFEDYLTSVVNETLFMRLIASGGPLWLVSTPNGINDYFEIVQSIQDVALPRRIAVEGDPELGGSAKVGQPIPIWETADQSALLWSTIEDNVGYGISEVEWQRMERTLDTATKEQQLRGAFLEPAEAFFVPSLEIAKAFRAKLPDKQMPVHGHRYVISWDPSATTDPTVVIVIDVTNPKRWIGVYFERWEKPLGETHLLVQMYQLHALYNGGSTQRIRGQEQPRAITTWDETSMGGALIGQSLQAMSPRRPTNLAGPNTKRLLLLNCRTALSTGVLILPKSWHRVMREVLTYKLPDDKVVQDCVMSLTGAAGVAAKGFSGNPKSSFRPHGRVAQGLR